MHRFPRKTTPTNPEPSSDYIAGFMEAEIYYMDLISWCRDYIEILERKLQNTRDQSGKEST